MGRSRYLNTTEASDDNGQSVDEKVELHIIMFIEVKGLCHSTKFSQKSIAWSNYPNEGGTKSQKLRNSLRAITHSCIKEYLLHFSSNVAARE